MKTITQLVQELKNTFSEKSVIAPVESSSTASQAYTTGQNFFYNNILYRATADISSGGTISPGTSVGNNCVPESKISTLIYNLAHATTGHTIKDGAGNTYTQRTNLQIKNATITDDATNDATIVEPDAETNKVVRTKAEWDALSQAEKDKYKTFDVIEDFNGYDVDDVPTSGSQNVVKSGGVYASEQTIKQALTTVAEKPFDIRFSDGTKDMSYAIHYIATNATRPTITTKRELSIYIDQLYGGGGWFGTAYLDSTGTLFGLLIQYSTNVVLVFSEAVASLATQTLQYYRKAVFSSTIEVIGTACKNSSGYAVGETFFASDGKLYKATSAITYDATTITVGTNCQETNISKELNNIGKVYENTLSAEASAATGWRSALTITNVPNGTYVVTFYATFPSVVSNSNFGICVQGDSAHNQFDYVYQSGTYTREVTAIVTTTNGSISGNVYSSQSIATSNLKIKAVRIA